MKRGGWQYSVDTGVISSARRTAGPKQQEHPQTTYPGDVGMNEIDNHADTLYAGLNRHLLKLSGEYCTVSPFSADYQPKPDVPIAKCATVYINN